MSNLSKIIEEIKSETEKPTPEVEEKVEPVEETPEEKPVETVTETSSETIKTENAESTEPKTETAPEAPVETKSEEKPDLNNISDLEKATYSFKKQMNKQKSKYESDLAELRKQIEELKTPKEQKFRDSFQNDDEYIDYIVGQKFDKMKSEYEQALRKKEEENRESEERLRQIDNNIKECFKTTEEQEDYRKTVQKSFDAGLEDLMNQEQYVSNYIMSSKNGPRILYDIAKDPNLANKIFSQPDPMSRILEVKLYERDLMNKKSVVTPPVVQKAVPETPIVTTPIKPIGRPGMSSETTGDDFDDPKYLRNLVRRR